jgi:preprotein translocase subunit YajC
LLGKITTVGESFITVEIADKVEIKVQRHAISSVMPKGTIKSA